MIGGTDYPLRVCETNTKTMPPDTLESPRHPFPDPALPLDEILALLPESLRGCRGAPGEWLRLPAAEVFRSVVPRISIATLAALKPECIAPASGSIDLPAGRLAVLHPWEHDGGGIPRSSLSARIPGLPVLRRLRPAERSMEGH